MNQKQRDYLIKRLTTIKEEKLAKGISEPDYKPFVKRIKVLPDTKLLSLLKKQIEKTIGNINNDKPYHYSGNKCSNDNVNGLSYSSSNFDLDIRDVSDVTEVNDGYSEYCKRHYKEDEERINRIEIKFMELCDKVVFAESLEEAQKIIAEFLKF